MAKRINFWELPVEDAQPDDTVPAYRGRGQVARVRLSNAAGEAVTSVGVSVPAGFQASNSPITSAGTIQIAFADGYGLPTTLAMTDWSAAFGWGDHALAGYASASSVASALSGKVGVDDVRLSDAREWSASTVPQATAEAGGSTVRFAWTTQRVWQAIAAWWQSISGAFGRTLAGTETAADARAQLGLGSTATADAGSFATAAQGLKADTAYGWGNHAGAGYAVSSAVTSALAGKVDITDVRLSDAREWSASTVTQATAEAGMSSVRFAWTAQRVWQAIAAWWNASAAKGKLDNIQAGATANSTDAQLRDRATHTGAQAISTVAGLQSALDTKVGTGDVRLSDEREWSASTVSQATAEEGTSTVRFAWTAQRVRQAIAAWWATITLTKADVGLGSVDNTADDQKTVKAFVITDTRAVVSVPNAVPARTGLFEFKQTASVGSPPEPSTANYAHVLTINGWTADGTGGWPTQISFGAGLAFRKGASATTWGPWNLLYHSGNAYSATQVDALISAATSGAWVWQATTAELAKNTPNKVDFSAPRTLTLPAAPAENDYVAILRTAGSTRGSVIARNGSTIGGLAENMNIDINVPYIRLDFVESSWKVAS